MIAWMNAHVAIIADVVNSREFADFAARRDRALQALQQQHGSQALTASDYAITAWDEFQVLLAGQAALPQVMWDLQREFYPLRLRLGIGCGEVQWARRQRDAVNEAASGEAFFLAREALDAISDQARGGSRSEILVRWNEPDLQHAINACARLLDVLLAGITAAQWQVINAYEQLGRQDAVAAALEKTPSTISRTLRSANYWEIKASLDDLQQLLASRTLP